MISMLRKGIKFSMQKVYFRKVIFNVVCSTRVVCRAVFCKWYTMFLASLTNGIKVL